MPAAWRAVRLDAGPPADRLGPDARPSGQSLHHQPVGPVISDQVNLDSLIDWVPGSPIRLKAGARPGDNHVAWLQVPNVSAGVLAALEYLATVRENRTRIVRNNHGLDAARLNKTASGMNMLMGAAQQRQELIARVLAETAIKRLYRLVYCALQRGWPGAMKNW